MLSRRDFLQVALATGALAGGMGPMARLAAQQRISEADLLRFEPTGQVTILHFADCHGQLMPLYFREPSVNLGVGDVHGLPPHVTGKDFLQKFGIPAGSHLQYALTDQDFVALARSYGRVGGMDRLARLVKSIRAERGAERTLVLDSGDTLHGSYTVLQSRGADMAAVLDTLGVEATTGHWEFTLGAERMGELFGAKDKPGKVKAAFLAGNIRDNEFDEPVFNATRMFEKGGVRIAVIGQAFPFTPIANPRWLMPKWSFGIREDTTRRNVAAARAAGAQLVILLSHNGFDVDRKLASQVDGIDIILTAHTHDALPVPVKVRNTLLVATGSAGKFLSRLDVEMKDGRMAGFSFALIPVLTDAIAPDAEMARLVAGIRKPHAAMLATELAHTESVLYRRGNFNGTLDDLICQAMLSERDAEICLSPGFRWGNSLLPGAAITWDDLYSATAISYPACYRAKLTGEALKAILEDVADNLFNPDPYYQQGGDMVRVGGMGYTIDVEASMGNRISDMTYLKTGAPIEPGREYVVAGWASVNEGTAGPPIWDLVAAHLRDKKVVRVSENSSVKIRRAT
jgi:sulfur-oxidizing protein SoxB